MQTEEKRNRFQQFVKNIPLEDILLAEKIISYAQQKNPTPFDESIYITLTDHLSAALERTRQNIAITNPLTSLIQSFYPTEFSLGVDAVKIIKEETGMSLSKDETAFFAIHFITAELGDSTPGFSTVLNFVKEVSGIVLRKLKNPVDDSSISWQRFLTHLSFFAQRFMSGGEKVTHEALLYDSVVKTYPNALPLVEEICAFIKNNYSYEVGLDEKTYLMIHINRLQIEFGIKD